MIPSGLLALARREFGEGAEEVVRANPYCLAGLADWWSVDRLGRSIGVPLEAPQRLGGALCDGIASLMSEHGHTVVEITEAERAAGMLLERRCDWSEAWALLLDDGLVSVADGLVQLSSMARVEHRLAQGLLRLSRGKRGAPSEAQVAAALRRIELPLSLAQRDAAVAAVSSGLSVLGGGPGCGKTAAVRLAVELADVLGVSVVLAAPTHRAAGRLSSVVGRPAVTLHRLLEARVDGSFEVDEIDADLVIMDESSLLDVVMAEALVERLRSGSHLMLVGDVGQLGSIAPGAVLRDVISSGVCPVTMLVDVMRQGAESAIVAAARRVAGGRAPRLANFEDDRRAEISFWDCGNDDEVDESMLELHQAGYEVLTTRRTGHFGADQMSERLRALARNRKPGLAVGDLVRLRQAEWSWRDGGIGAGVVGRVVNRSGEYGDRVAVVDFGGQRIEYPQREWDRLVHALVGTVHGSQGHEWPEVALYLGPSAGRLACREVLYTAITRARHRLVVFGERATWRAAALRVGVPRVTRLSELLQT